VGLAIPHPDAASSALLASALSLKLTGAAK